MSPVIDLETHDHHLVKNDPMTLVTFTGLGLAVEHLLGTISGLTSMYQISILVLDQTTGEIGMGSPQASG